MSEIQPMNYGQKSRKQSTTTTTTIYAIEFGPLFFINYLMNYRLCVVIVIWFIAFNLSVFNTMAPPLCVYVFVCLLCACDVSTIVVALVYDQCSCSSSGGGVTVVFFFFFFCCWCFCCWPRTFSPSSNCEQINLTWHRNKWTFPTWASTAEQRSITEMHEGKNEKNRL